MKRDFSTVTPEIESLADLCSADSRIDPALYVEHRVNRGLRDLNGNGVLTGLTEISEITAKQIVDGQTLPCAGELPTQEQIDQIYSDFYAASPFVHVLTGGVQPKTSSVAGTNNAHVACIVHKHAHALVATGAIDNIGKGAAGQAVQCANIVFGLPEATGFAPIAIPVM